MTAPQGKSRAQIKAEDRIAAVRNAAASRRNTTRKRPDGIPDVYQEMLSEAASSSEPGREEQRPTKKRRIENEAKVHAPSNPISTRKKPGTGHQSIASSVNGAGSETDDQRRPRQTVEDSGDSEDEDIDWEQIDFDDHQPSATSRKTEDDIADISVEVGPKKTPRKAVMKRKPATTAEKLLRMAVHEAHLLFLLFHVHVRNSWCNLDAVQVCLRSFILRIHTY